MSDATWMDASIDELRTLYADRLSDLEYEYGLRCATEAQVAELKAQVAELWTQLEERDATIASLVERVARCNCTDDFGNVAE